MAETVAGAPPRVLIVMRDQWRRALLRAALREVGYDAIGARDARDALLVRLNVPGRGPVRLVIIDQSAFAGGGAAGALASRYPGASTLLLARATIAQLEGAWSRVLRRPFSIDDVVVAAESALPLPTALQHPLDDEPPEVELLR
jgi:DNA-binding response OmpR family regulator